METILELIEGQYYFEAALTSKDLLKIGQGELVTTKDKLKGKPFHVGFRMMKDDYAPSKVSQ